MGHSQATGAFQYVNLNFLKIILSQLCKDNFLIIFLALSNEEDLIQSLSWKEDGTTLVSTCRDKKIRITDPRANAVTQVADNHTSNRESMGLWLGSSNRVLTSGFDSVKFDNS